MQHEFLTPADAPVAWTTPAQQLTRRSVRRYVPRPISKAVIEQLLHVAASAPSAHNRQPWRFAVLRTPEHKALLANAMGQRLRQDRQTDQDPNADIDADVARSFARITGAACVVVVSLSMHDMDVYPDAPRSRNEFRMALQSTAMAGQNLLLAAHGAGLGACWLCAPLFCPDTVSQVLELPPDWEPQGMITLGHPANSGKPFVRKNLSEVALFLDEDKDD